MQSFLDRSSFNITVKDQTSTLELLLVHIFIAAFLQHEMCEQPSTPYKSRNSLFNLLQLFGCSRCLMARSFAHPSPPLCSHGFKWQLLKDHLKPLAIR